MFYANYNLSTPDPQMFAGVVEHCPYGILHVKNEDSGGKLAILVKVFYSHVSGLSFRIAHNYKVLIEDLAETEVSLKLCNREKNIYVVADVKISPAVKNGLLSKAYLKGAITRFNLFKKNKSDQMIAYNNAV
ncbi:MAG: hypothetical protein EOP48_05160 [Sphingobacteriales bacterium]|nr:MAG: hypothetical protein EOP48_05160 [Sphingobacteriales bacterium]